MQIVTYLKESILDFFKNKTYKFYIALGAAVLSVITAIVYVSALAHLKGFMSWIPFILMLTGALVFLALSVFKFSRLGSAIMAALNFTAFIVFAATIYKWPVEQAMLGNVAELPAIIVSAVLMLVCMVVSNVCAWLALQKKQDGVSSEN